MTTVALITTCKGRLHHLRQTLPLMLAQGADQVIVVDYDCPDDTGDWVAAHHPAVDVARVYDRAEFNLAEARNVGARLAQTDWLVFVDADIETVPGWVDWMRREVRPGNYYKVAKVDGVIDGQTSGTAICARSDFVALDGYDEVIAGWGGEDFDLYERLGRRGVALARYPSEFVSAIHHGNDERAGWDGMQNSGQKWLLEKCYQAMKMHVTEARGGASLSVEARRSIRDETRKAIATWYAEGQQKPLTLRFGSPVIKPERIPGNNVVRADTIFTIQVQHLDPPA